MPSPQKFTNWRFNPFTNTTNPTALTEEHAVQYFPEANLYGIQAHEGIVLDNPSTVSLAFKETNANTNTVTEVPLQEVPKSQAPSAGQFRVDYDAETFFGTSLIELNSSDVDKKVILRYKGTGAIVKNEYIFNQLSRIPTSFAVGGKTTLESELEAKAKASLKGELEVSGAAKLLADLLLPNSDIASDQQNKVLNYSQIQSLLFARNLEILTSSGTWTKPAHIERVLVITIGGGGGPFLYRNAGASEGQAYNGSSGEMRLALLDVKNTQTVNYTVGAAGLSSDINASTVPQSQSYTVSTTGYTSNPNVTVMHGGATSFLNSTAAGGKSIAHPNFGIGLANTDGSGGLVLSEGGALYDGNIYIPRRYHFGFSDYGIGYYTNRSTFRQTNSFTYHGKSGGAIILIY